MPNQLSQTKKRFTVAEHRAVLAALEIIAEAQNSTIADLLRKSLRQIVAEHANDPNISANLRRTLSRYVPVMPEHFRSPAKVSKFKKEQREFDQLIQELHFLSPTEVQQRNSIVRNPQSIRLTSIA